MDMTDRRLAYPKDEPNIVTKKRRAKIESRNERACREIVRKRDGGRCRIPNCNSRDVELHHIVFRSKSSRLKWDARNCCLLCKEHHSLRHAGIIDIKGDADGELIITGDVNRLKFKI